MPKSGRFTALFAISFALLTAILYFISYWSSRVSAVAPPKGATLDSVYGCFGTPIQEMTCREAAEKYKSTEYGDFRTGCQRVLVFDTRVFDGGLILGSWWTEHHIIGFDRNEKSTSYATTLK